MILDVTIAKQGKDCSLCYLKINTVPIVLKINAIVCNNS